MLSICAFVVQKLQAKCINNTLTLSTYIIQKLQLNNLMTSSSFLTMKYVMRRKTSNGIKVQRK